MNVTLTTNIPIKIPSPLNDPVYYSFRSSYTTYHALILDKQICSGKNTETIKKIAIRQHDTAYYLSS